MSTKKKPQRIEFPAQMALARQIAGDLFDGGPGVTITRLLQETSRKHVWGGWCREAVIERIYKHLIGELPK